MTINKLIKALTKIQDKYGKRLSICVEPNYLIKIANSDYSHHSLQDVEVDNIVWNINDNSELANGTTRTRNVVVLK